MRLKGVRFPIRSHAMFRSLLFLGAAAIALLASPALAQEATEIDGNVTVTAQRLDAARSAIQTQVGASSYTVSAADISRASRAATISSSIR